MISQVFRVAVGVVTAETRYNNKTRRSSKLIYNRKCNIIFETVEYKCTIFVQCYFRLYPPTHLLVEIEKIGLFLCRFPKYTGFVHPKKPKIAEVRRTRFPKLARWPQVGE